MKTSIFSFLVLAQISIAAHSAENKKVCKEVDVRRIGANAVVGNQNKLGFCIFKSDNNPQNRVMFFLHGLGHSENQFDGCNGFFKPVAKEMRNRGQMPHVVTISMGKIWRINRQSEVGPRALSIIEQQVLPFVEQHLGALTPERTILFGESMGGYNASIWTLRRPHFFSRVLISSPAMSEISPFSSFAEVSAYTAKTNANPLWVMPVYFYLKQDIASTTPQLWIEEESPNYLLAQKMTTQAEVFVASALDDSYGFQVGTQEFFDEYSRLDPRATFKGYRGDHCTIDVNDAADFLTR